MSDDILQSEESIQFFSLIHMLQRSALVGLGLMPDNEGEFNAHLEEAKAAIDLIGVLQKRTEGNLEETEQTLLQGILTELRMQFVQAPAKVERKQAEQEAAEELKEVFTDPASAPVETLIDDDAEKSTDETSSDGDNGDAEKSTDETSSDGDNGDAEKSTDETSSDGENGSDSEE